ncbi:MAG TPA: alternate-type signal peptide domain-containing protein [Beutenbergiaceae bacterium]|nr:alternate-type signal peptide domain-containing protein [Beutenbergiaceae bacterium]
MTTPPLPTPTGRLNRRWRAPMLAGAGLLTGLLISGGTFALWNTDGAASLGQIVAGDLDISLEGETTWEETSSDVVDRQTDLDPATFLARPGDTFQITQDFTTTLQGDNMLAATTVAWADPAALPAQVSATYRVLDSAGTQVTEVTAVGDAAALAAIGTDNQGRQDHYTLQIELEFAVEAADRFGPEAEAILADLGEITIDLEQTRTGEGYQS